MKSYLVSLILLAGTVAFAAPLANVCYDTVDSATFCTNDNIGKVQVLVFNAGWCGACNQEMSELPDVYETFAGQSVVFVSLSGEGWSRGAAPNQVFLKQWQQTHQIPFVVAGKHRDFGTSFGATGTIPFVAIADKAGNIQRAGNLSPAEIKTIVQSLL